MKLQETPDYKEFFIEIISTIERARYDAFKSVNYNQIQQNFKIGKIIVDRQNKYGWGKSIVEKLSTDLKKIIDGTKGYSAQNLWNMRQFYIEYKDKEKLFAFCLSVPWSHNILIIQKIKNDTERLYYLKATEEMAWSRAVLLNQIKANAFEYQKQLPKQSNYEKALPEHLSEQANEALKSGYNLDFLGIIKPIRERELENLLIGKIKDFLLELGYGFCFIGNQFKLTFNEREYYLDLLFYHRILKCLVVVELKSIEFDPIFAGKMDIYLELVDKQLKQKDDNPSIGIILCPSKDKKEVEFALNIFHKPIGVAEYKLTTELPEKLQGKLPTAKEISDKVFKSDNDLKKKR